jgi:hypothetical protein
VGHDIGSLCMARRATRVGRQVKASSQEKTNTGRHDKTGQRSHTGKI